MPKHEQLQAVPRTVLGKKVKKLRRQGELPAVIYGPVIEGAKSITVNAREFDATYKIVGMNSLIDLSVEGQPHTVFVREVQVHPVRRDVLHIDFYAPNMSEPIDATITIVTTGEFDGIGDVELTTYLHEIDVRALPEAIPNHIEIDISGLQELGDQLHVSDFTVAEGVEITTDPDEVVFRVDQMTIAEEEEEAEEAAEAAAEEPSLVGGEEEEEAEEEE